MIDEEEARKPPAPAADHDGELLLYDFFKHLMAGGTILCGHAEFVSASNSPCAPRADRWTLNQAQGDVKR